jgi:hypothetical protein
MNLSDSEDQKPPRLSERRSRPRSAGGDLGQALRKVYDHALNEDIPPEMLDLLGKLD